MASDQEMTKSNHFVVLKMTITWPRLDDNDKIVQENWNISIRYAIASHWILHLIIILRHFLPLMQVFWALCPVLDLNVIQYSFKLIRDLPIFTYLGAVKVTLHVSSCRFKLLPHEFFRSCWLPVSVVEHQSPRCK